MEEVLINTLREWLSGSPGNPGLLKQNGLTVEQLARKIGKRRATLYYMLEGTNQPSEESLRGICNVLGVSYEEGLKHATPRPAHRPASGTSIAKPRKKRRMYEETEHNL